MLTTFRDIQSQAFVDDLCAEFRKVDALLGLPKHDLPNSFHRYIDEQKTPPIWHMTRFFRNIAALDKYEAVVERLDPFFLAIEYFSGKIVMQRTDGPALAKTFLDSFFASALADSFRSALDIYSKFIGWFFDFSHRETMGFSYKGLIVPLRKHSRSIADECNTIYTSPDFQHLKTFRDSEKHEGLGKHRVSLADINGTLKINLVRPTSVDISKIERSACSCIEHFYRLLKTTSEELKSCPMGYDSPNDRIAAIDEEGYFRMT